MSEQQLQAIEVNPPVAVKASVIWLHGLGADGNDFVPAVPALDLPDGAGVRFVFPHAPRRPVTLNAGRVMRAWYDVGSTEFDRKEDAEGIQASARAVCDLIEAEHAAGVPYERIVLAGFSQGCAMALHTGLRFPHRLAGVLALSGYLPLAGTLSAEADASNRQVPILMAHGLHDAMVPLTMAEASHQRLTGLGYEVEWRTYPMAHTLVVDEIADIARWLRKVLAL